MEPKLEYTKMKERIDWAFDFLKQKAIKEKLEITDETLFNQACEVGRTLFVRSEIGFSSRKE